VTGLPRDVDAVPGVANANVRVARWIAEALRPAQGPLDVVISPGSRNTPLTLAFEALAAAGRAQLHVVLDERAAAFVALGLGKVRGRAAVLCCTSGSAAGHYVPAVMEAGNSRVPLILLTADRPPELHGCGAPQTVTQAGMFAPWAQRSLTLAVPDEAADPTRTAAIGRQIRQVAEGRPAGPVHLNLPFRKPLWTTEGVGEDDDLPARPMPTLRPISPRPDASTVDRLAAELDGNASRGLILCGPRMPATLDAGSLTRAVAKLARRLGWPVLADPASGLGEVAERVEGYDLFLRHGQTGRALAPSVVLQIGATPTSKATGQWLTSLARGKLLPIDGDGALADPNGLAPQLTVADPIAICDALAEHEDLTAAPASWLARWRSAAEVTATTVSSALARPGWQGHLARLTVDALPAGALLHLASSMPIRDVDAFGGGATHLAVEASRGVNGIDGTLATFLGMMIARRNDGATHPGAALLGDLAFLHDLDGLATWAQIGRDLPATAVVIDNGGGRIFDLLPIAEQIDSERFERLFATPQRASFGPLCEAFGHRFHSVSAEGFGPALADEIERPGLGVIAVTVDPKEDRAAHQEVTKALSEALDRHVATGQGSTGPGGRS
jgi:2-succinyl-5-enolpyruvyl-6-hydroxy-3-cyclohexene-1-carboxylate synthase